LLINTDICALEDIVMRNVIAASELILNSRGAVYHLNLRPEEIANTIITVGDPDRVKEVSKYFDKIEHRSHHREFITHTGFIGPKRISVVSTGIGTDNIDIVLTELDALVNIDFTTRFIKDSLTSLKIIRMGTCGGLQEDIPTDGLIVSSYGLGLDNLLHFYLHESSEDEKILLEAFCRHVGWGADDPKPYLAVCDRQLAGKFTKGYFRGITVTCPGFYAPQGRKLRGIPAYPSLIDLLPLFQFEAYRITNFEMETSAIYGLGKVLGHQCLSISTVVANRVRGEFSKDSNKAVDHMIQHSLEQIIAS
jgi:uridine phosphorylase